VHRAELVGQAARPVLEDVRQWRVLGEREGQVEVGVRIAVAARQRADLRRPDDPRVRAGELQHPVADPVALLDREHPRAR
jgi:hypothetical protein